MGTAVISLAAAFGLALPCAGQLKMRKFTFAEPHMGTLCRITLFAPDADLARQAASAAYARIAQLDDMMTDYRSTSELMQLCQKAGKGAIHVSDDLFTVLAYAQEISNRSDGAFDISVGPLVQLWRLAHRTQIVPDRAKIEQARALVGYAAIHLDPNRHTVRLGKQGMRLDLGGIAKGYAADEALRVLRERGIHSALVAAGGDVAAGDAPPGKRGWKVGIAPLKDPSSAPSLFLSLANSAVSTSGDAEQHVIIDGKRYSHIIDPTTGTPLVGRRSVSVIAPRGITADSLTKVISVLGPVRGFAIIDKVPGAAAYVVQEITDKQEIFSSSLFHEYVQGANQ
jgi:thiamine biosynthesis lipoprotein